MAKKILFINQEIAPYVAETELAKLGNELPQRMQEKGFEIRTFMPKWNSINERRGQLHEVIRLSGMNLIINDTDHPLIIKVASLPVSRLQIYFIDNEDYFKNKAPKENEVVEKLDDGEQAVFFARGVLETVKKLRWIPDIICCQGMLASVIPFYIKTAYADEPSFNNAKVVTTLFKEDWNGVFEKDFKAEVEFKDATRKTLKNYADDFNIEELGKLAVDYSDAFIKQFDDTQKQQLAYAKKTKRPLLTIKDEDIATQYTDFFNKICPE